jgi:hypothetical protein
MKADKALLKTTINRKKKMQHQGVCLLCRAESKAQQTKIVTSIFRHSQMAEGGVQAQIT